ncbi:hypothetical protein PIB30_102323 [Stylosanthes scabra]|uniref:Uncharacterized protein n=1 Tax=Stylosanthes scabra TaxID=79078 RepID=A0ABU6RXI5_9FABA|nr:hypothetical protein [Stylosanthes scabra]
MKINSTTQANTKPPDITTHRQECKATTPRSGKSTRNEIQNQKSAEDSYSPPPKEKKKKEPIAYIPKPPYPQRLKAENKNKAPKKEPKEESATNDSMEFNLIQKKKKKETHTWKARTSRTSSFLGSTTTLYVSPSRITWGFCPNTPFASRAPAYNAMHHVIRGKLFIHA